MTSYEFTLKFSLQGTSLDPKDHINRLFECGCDDALVGVGKMGSIALGFTREHESALAAISSALADVRAAIPEARLIEAAPDWVGLTDVADILGCSRQNIRQIMNRNMDTFPLPVHEGKAAIWHLFTLLIWLRERNAYPVDDAFAELAKTTMKINAAKEASVFGAELLPIYALVG